MKVFAAVIVAISMCIEVDGACTLPPRSSAAAPRIGIVVLGDGFSKAEEDDYCTAVQTLITDGIFKNWVFGRNASSFEVCAVRSISDDSGVSTALKRRHTSFDLIYNGDRSKGYFEYGWNTATKIADASASCRRTDYTVLIVNIKGITELDAVGRSFDTTLVVAKNVIWPTAEHEFGHSVGSLYDEYGDFQEPCPDRITDGNCTTETENVSWFGGAPTPPVMANPPQANPAQLGLYEGCNRYQQAVYRPSNWCAMFDMQADFCPVCERRLKEEIALRTPVPPLLSERYLRLTLKASVDGVQVLRKRFVRATDVMRSSARNAWTLKAGGDVIAVAPATSGVAESRVYETRLTVTGQRVMESRIDSGDHYFSIDVPEKSAQKILEAQPLRLEQLGFPELRLLDPARPADATPLTFPNAQENIGIDSAHHGVKDPVLRLSIKAPKVQQAISSAFK